MNRLFLTILTALFTLCTLSARNIVGKVIEDNDSAMAYVSCMLYVLPDSTFIAGTITDVNGCFEIEVSDNEDFLIKLSYLGYQAKEVYVIDDDLGTIVLNKDAQALQEVVVTGEIPTVTYENNRLTYNVSGILKDKVVSNAHDLIKELPIVMSLDGNSLSLVGASSTTVCISGKKSQMSAEQLNDYLKSLPAEEIEKVEILYNAPAQWHVQGSVINVVVKKHRNYNLTGQVQGGWVNQHRNSFNVGGSIMASTPKWDFDFMYKFSNQRNISQTNADGVHTVTGINYDIHSITTDCDKANKHYVYANIGYKIDESNNLSVSYNGQLSPKTTSTTSSRNSAFSDAQSNDVGSNYLHALALSYTSQKGISAGVEYTNFSNSGTQSMFINDKHSFDYWRTQDINKIYGYVDASSSFSHNWTLNYGANYNYVRNVNKQQYDENPLTETNINEHSATAYIGFQKPFWGGKFSVSATLAGEYYKIGDYEKPTLLPNVELSYIPSYTHIFQLSYNSLRNYPTYWQRQDYTSYSDEYSISEGNPLLKPARTSNVNLNYVLKNKYVFQVSYYRVNDFFVDQSYQMPEQLNLLYKTFNIDFTSNFTFTAIIPVNIGKWLKSNVIVSGYNERYKSNDWYGYKYDRNKWTGMIMLNNTFIILQNPKLTANLMVFYRTPTIQGIWDLSDNWGVNAGLRYSFLKNNAILSLQGTDLFESFIPKIKARECGQYQDIDTSNFTRNISLTFTYKFNGFKDKQRKQIDSSRFGIQ